MGGDGGDGGNLSSPLFDEIKYEDKGKKFQKFQMQIEKNTIHLASKKEK